jgi:hypothetical protein
MEIDFQKLKDLLEKFKTRYGEFCEEIRLEERESGWVIWAKAKNSTVKGKIPLSYGRVPVIKVVWKKKI